MDRDQAIRLMQELLRKMMELGASDLFITAEFPPAMKVDGNIKPVGDKALTPMQSNALVRAIMNDRQTKEFDATKECNFAIAPKGIGRFRVSSFVQQGLVVAVLRTINTEIPTFDDLDLPPVLKDVAMAKRGLVIIVGGTGSGKSTTLAAMMDYKNDTEYGHILTIEDPIEFVHQSKKCLINQREVHRDTLGFAEALRSALREDPDIILVGDSVANVVLGHDDTLAVSVDVMIHHTAAVARTGPNVLVVGDMPWLSYHSSREDTVANAGRFIREGGAGAVKLGGGRKRLPMIDAVLDADMAHLGAGHEPVIVLHPRAQSGRGPHNA